MADYIITRTSSDELMHFGIKGQKWGVRRFENKDGTLTEEGKKRYGTANGGSGNEKLDKKFNRDVKKLGRAYDRADLNKQVQDYAKYDKRTKTANRIGKAALAITVPAAAASYVSSENVKRDIWNKLADANNEAYKGSKLMENLMDRTKGYGTYGQAEEYRDAFNKITKATSDLAMKWPDYKQMSKINNIATPLANAAAITAGVSFGVAAYSKVRATVAKRRISEIGHNKAMAKVETLCNKLAKTYANTPYSTILNARIDAYKEEHPNTQLSNKEIIKALT